MSRKPGHPSNVTQVIQTHEQEATTDVEPTGHVEVAPDPAPVDAALKAIKTLPPGVQMHDDGKPPVLPDPEPMPDARVPTAPPKGHAGSYERCGVCGDFIPNGVSACPRCTGDASIATLPKPMAGAK